MAGSAVGSGKRSRATPNVLLVMADRLAPHVTGTDGHPVVSTPHLDALAERGVGFDAGYCHSPLCAPARFPMPAGRSVGAIGARDNAAEFPASETGLDDSTWDHLPANDVVDQYVRNHRDVVDAARRSRLDPPPAPPSR